MKMNELKLPSLKDKLNAPIAPMEVPIIEATSTVEEEVKVDGVEKKSSKKK